MFVVPLRRAAMPAVVVFALLFLSACVSTSTQPLSPAKSPADDREYRLLTLDNNMQVLLISDPDTPKAAAALDVLVGSGDNPDGRAGLAHFLEHMLFLGTDKYPDAAEYEQFITEHGGRRNAYTSFEHTNYFFDINAPYLPEALDRFAQFFIAPRFDAQYVEREKQAVEAEYQMGLKSDGRRGLDVLQEVMNPEHPFSQFSVGSLQTLADRPNALVRDDLITFYDKHYSANVMRLVVLGTQSLDELQEIVVPMFSQVPDRSFSHDKIEQPFFAAGSLPLMVEIEPLATLKELQVSFPIDDYRDLYHVKPVSYLGNLVGHEGEGSLLSQLKAEGLAEGLGAGSGFGWRGGSLFSVSISLTEKGVQQRERVLELLFAYMDMLRNAGPVKALYQEQARIADLSFRFKEQVEPMNYVSALASGMHYYAPEDVLEGPYLMEDYREDVLSGLLQRLTPDNALIMLTDKSVATDTVSRYYDVPYSSRTLASGELSQPDAAQFTELLKLPEPNGFIADDISLVDIDPESSQQPVVVVETPRQKVWFMQDSEFRIPKGATYINFRSTEVGDSAQHSAAASLYAALLKDSVNEFAYPARLAGLNFSLYKHAQGISLRISGYDDKQAALLQELLANIESPVFSQQRFGNIRQDMIRDLRNAVAKRPSSQVMDDLRESLLYGEWGEQAMIDALQSIDLAGVQRYAQEFWRSATAETLIYGNYDAAVASRVSSLLAALLPDTAPPPMPTLEVLKLSAGEGLQYVVDVPHDDAVLAWYLQAAGNDWVDRAASSLTAQIMKSGFFQQLRTEQQLGYVVSTFYWPQLDVPGVVMIVQSPVADAAGLADAMQTFMLGVQPALDEQQFTRHKAALLADILQPDKNLWERAEFYWQSIAKKQLDFDGKQALAEAVDTMTLEQWREYYDRVFIELRHSLQVVAPGKAGKLPAGDYQRFVEADAIKAGHQTYTLE